MTRDIQHGWVPIIEDRKGLYENHVEHRSHRRGLGLRRCTIAPRT